MGDSEFFHNVDYVKGSDGYFNSADPYYWPGDDSELKFYAYSPSQDELGADVVIDTNEKQLENYIVDEDPANHVDFITSIGTGKKSVNETSGLELTFSHRLSQIELRAKSESKNYTFKVAGMRIGRLHNNASYDFDKNTWTLDEWQTDNIIESYCDTLTLNATPVSIMGKSGNAMVIPQKSYAWTPASDPDNVAHDTYLSVLVRVETTDGACVYPFPTDKVKDETTGKNREFAWAAVPVAFNLEQGKKYVYTLDFTKGAGFVDPDDPTPGVDIFGDPIKFTVNVEDWTTQSIDPIDMPTNGGYSKTK